MRNLIFALILIKSPLVAQDSPIQNGRENLNPPEIQIRTSPGWDRTSQGVLTGIVKDEFQLPVKNAKVWTHFHQTESQSRQMVVVTDQNGAFTIVLPAGNYHFNTPVDKTGRCNNREKFDGCIWIELSSGLVKGAEISSYNYSIQFHPSGSRASLEIFLQHTYLIY